MHRSKIGYRLFGEMAHSIIPFSIRVRVRASVFSAEY